ncbi:MAG: hypothetical protein ABIH83_03435 [Candidatus Micrarchaeota archaeon]
MPVLMQAFVEKKPDEEKLRKKKKPPQEAETPEPPKEIHLSQPHFEKGRYVFNLSGTKKEEYIESLRKMNIFPGDFNELQSEIDKIYNLANAGIIDLSNVVMGRLENGTLRLNVGFDKLFIPFYEMIKEETGFDDEHIREIVETEDHPDKEKLLDVVMKVIFSLSEYKGNSNYVKTPEQFAVDMLNWKAMGKEAHEIPEGNCVDYALLVNEILKGLGFDSSIIGIIPLDKYGTRETGHTTAAVVVEGYIIDPAAFSEPKKVEKIVITRGKKRYNEFQFDIMKIYSGYFKDAVGFEFSEYKNEDELKSLYYYENAIRKKKHSPEYKKNAKMAVELQPSNIYAADLAGFMYKVMGDDAKDEKDKEKAEEMYKKSTEIYRRMLESNPESYLAILYAVNGFYNIYINEKRLLGEKPKKFMEILYEKYAKKACRMYFDMVKSSKTDISNYEKRPLPEEWIFLLGERIGKKKDAEKFISSLRAE